MILLQNSFPWSDMIHWGNPKRRKKLSYRHFAVDSAVLLREVVNNDRNLLNDRLLGG